MVRDQLEQRGIRDRRVLEAMSRVPREIFVDTVDPLEAYDDCALPIACGQTISQPLIVAMMTEALELSGDEKVLEIGTGSGYQAAVLAELAARVVSIENHPELSAAAARALATCGYANVRTIVGDGTLGCPEEAPFDRIIVTAAAAHVPQALLDQMTDGGLLVVPVGDQRGQVLEKIRRLGDEWRATPLAECRFVPLVGAQDGA